MSRVLVELEVEEGLPAKLDIHWEGGIHVQRLDFMKVPFCYHRCRKTRHLKRDCPRFASMYDSVSDEGDSRPYFSQKLVSSMEDIGRKTQRKNYRRLS
jgi:hypothetical protein